MRSIALAVLFFSSLSFASTVPSGYVLNTGNGLYTNLAAIWPFNEASGNPVDTKNSIGCTLSGSTPPTWGTGDGGPMLSFTAGAATVSYLSCGTPAPVQDCGNGHTCSFAFRVSINSTNAAVNLAERNDNNSVNAGWFIGGTGTQLVGFSHEYSSTNLNVQVVSPSATTYHTVVFTFAGTAGTASHTNAKIYFDGTEQTTRSPDADGSGTVGSDSGQTLYIGRHQFGNPGSLDGKLAWVAIWRDRVLDSTEVTTLSGSTGFTDMFQASGGATGTKHKGRVF